MRYVSTLPGHSQSAITAFLRFRRQSMRAHTAAINAQIPAADWYRALAAYEQPNLRRASWQLLNTFVPYATLWILMVWMVRREVSPWWIAALLIVAAGLLVR